MQTNNGGMQTEPQTKAEAQARKELEAKIEAGMTMQAETRIAAEAKMPTETRIGVAPKIAAGTRIAEGTREKARTRTQEKLESNARKLVATMIASETNEILRRAGRIVRAVLDRGSLLAATAFLANAAGAASTDPSVLFEAGRIAFQQGDYQAALENYEAAAAAGLEGSALDFNIGVAAFRAGKLNRAEEAFTRAARAVPMASLAQYNLGLVAQARGDQDSAQRWFEQVANSDDEKLRSLARRQLGKSDATAHSLEWYGYANAAIGHDDNVALSPDADVIEVSGREDQFLEAQAGLTAILDSNWRVEAGLDQFDYFDLDDFDVLSTHAAGRYRFVSADWTHEARAQLTYSRVGGDSFETRRTLSLQSTRPLSTRWRFRGRYRFNHLEGLGTHDGLDGTRHELQARFTYSREPVHLTVSYEYELNDQRSRSFASNRHDLRVFAERQLSRQWSIETDAGLQRSHYGASGNDLLKELGLSVVRVISEDWRVVARYSYSSNESDQADLEYDVNRVSVGAEVRF